MITIYVNAVGLSAPGLDGWGRACSVLAGELPYHPRALDRYQPRRLPSNERRRATEVVRLAFRACEDAVESSALDPSALAGVFASSGGDYFIVDKICRALRQPLRAVSPTQFHNSVHNAVAGYWSIASGSRLPSTSLAGNDGSFSAGLLEAATQVAMERMPSILSIYDCPPPAPLLAERQMGDPFAVTFILTPAVDETTLAVLTIGLSSDLESESRMDEPVLESVRTANPAARSLPLLEAIARKSSGRLYFAMPTRGMLAVDIAPC